MKRFLNLGLKKGVVRFGGSAGVAGIVDRLVSDKVNEDFILESVRNLY